MKRILENKISSLTASSVNSEFPVSCLFTDSPNDLYMARDGINTVVITGYVNGGFTDLQIVNTNATSVSITLVDPMESFLVNGYFINGSFINSHINYSTSIMMGESNNIYIDIDANDQKLLPAILPMRFVLIPITRTIKFTLTMKCPAGETFYAGRLDGGLAFDYMRSPVYGLTLTPDDSPSTNIALKDGSRYYKHIKTGRVHAGVIQLSHEYAKAFIDHFTEYGQIATSIKMTDLDSSEWSLYGHFTSVQRAYSNFKYSGLTFEFVEEI